MFDNNNSKLASFPLSDSKQSGICSDIVLRSYLLKTVATSLIKVVSTLTPMSGRPAKTKIKFSCLTKPCSDIYPSGLPFFSSTCSVLLLLSAASTIVIKVSGVASVQA